VGSDGGKLIGEVRSNGGKLSGGKENGLGVR
jgi:hypothetical protein